MTVVRWQERYRDKLRTAAQALEVIKPGDRVFIGSACAAPQLLVEALARNPTDDIEITHILTMGLAPYVEKQLASRFRANAYFISMNVREAVWDGRADYTPIFLSEIPALFRTRQTPLDVALISVTPPDEHGFCSLGISVDITKAAAESAQYVIAEVNPHLPRTLGNSFLHVSRIDFLVESGAPVIEFRAPVQTEIAKRIARNVAELVEDGATIQVGYGGIPDALLPYLKGKRDLGVHTEVFSDGIVDLIESGVITNNRKTIHRGKVIASFCMGTRRLYDFVDNNPMFEFHPVDYTNDPFVIAQNEKMVSINSAMEIDLTGQVCADSIGYRFYSGIGGQLDFVRGAARSRGGKPIIVLPSTRDNGAHSRIVPNLSEGAGVVTSRGDVHYVVTEWGAAYLHGKNIRERTLSLIAIADPAFRSELLRLAKERHYIYADQPEISLVGARYPEELETAVALKDGRRVLLRPIRPTDEALVRDLFYSFSQETVFYRFFSYLKAMPHEKLSKFVNVDYDQEMALAAVLKEDGMDRIIGIASYHVDRATALAEFAIVIKDDYQNAGIGTTFFEYLIRVARMKGVRGFVGYVLDSNTRAYRMIHKVGIPVETKWEDGVYTLTLRFPDETRKHSSDI